MGKERKNPFRAGMGEVPPHLAGHEDAVRELTRRLDRLFDERPGRGVVVYGPRGTGKTALLTESHERAKKRKVRVIELNTGDMTGKPEDLGKMLAPPRRVRRPAIRKLMAMFPWGGAGVEFEDSEADSPEDVLRRLLKDPLLLMVDEAHTIRPDFAMLLLQISQRCIRDKLPLLLVLAGTPVIEANLGRADASFWERATRVRLGRLESKDATRDALSIPTEREGMPFSPDALEFLVAESQGYPYFIQLVGERSWDAAIARDPDATHIGMEDAQAGVLAANKARNELYAGRLQEVNNRRILREAVAVSRAFHAIGGDGVLPGTELERALMPLLAGDRTVHDILQELFAVGLVWQTDDPALWEPGIPSLCTHIAKYALTGGDSGGVPAP